MLIVSMICDLYRKHNGESVWKRVYVFSPSVNADPVWEPVKKFVRDKLEVPHDEQWAWDHYDPGAMLEVIETQRKVIAIAKEKGLKKLFGILLVIDDFADDPRMSRQDRLLHSLYTRGRHAFISTITAISKVQGALERYSSQRHRSDRLPPAVARGAGGDRRGELGGVRQEDHHEHDTARDRGAVLVSVHQPGGEEARGDVLAPLREAPGACRCRYG
jgi:hypothetical protein